MRAHAGGSQARTGHKASAVASQELGVNRIAADTAFTALKLVCGTYLTVPGR